MNKEYNVKRHFTSKHKQYNVKSPITSTEKTNRLTFLQQLLSTQHKVFMTANTVRAHEAGLTVASTLCKHKMPFGDAEVVSECRMQMI